VPDDLPRITDTPGDRCRFEACKPKCINDPDRATCTSNDDCDPGEGPCDCPGADEDIDGNLRDDHNWYAAVSDDFKFIPSATGLSYGSPHGSWCPARVKSHTGGVLSAFDTQPPSEVTVRDVMSYHGAYCKGPYVVAGDRREAFSPDQLDRIAACRSDIEPRDSAHLPDVCANLGGDSDQDGICDGDDNCPSVLNTCQADSDDDGFGDACDCPGAGPNGGDLDGDGIPDECDADRDGDGCYNDPPEDDHPDQARLLERTFVQVGCGSGSKSTYVSDVADTDGDGIINCMDHDDDNDGLCEVAGPDCTAIGDPCPEVPGSFCITPVADAPCAPIWTYCGAPCVEH
jgi:hypothetical protein